MNKFNFEKYFERVLLYDSKIIIVKIKLTSNSFSEGSYHEILNIS